MIPAILLHGGHHLSDVLGVIAIFFIALRLARSVLKTIRPTAAF